MSKLHVPFQGFVMLSNEYNVLNLNLATVLIYLFSEDSWTFSLIHRITSKNECVADYPKENE